MELKIPEFNLTLDTLYLDPPDIYTRKQKRKKIDLSIKLQSLPPSYTVILNRCNKIINKIRNLFDIV